MGDFGCKNPLIGGKKGTIIAKPCVNKLKISERTDFILLGCNYIYLFLIIIIIGDGIFDSLSNDEIFNKIWGYKKKGQIHNDIRELCGKITDGIIKYSMQKKSADNVSVIFIAFKNFEDKMKDPDFEYVSNTKTKSIMEQYDFSLQI